MLRLLIILCFFFCAQPAHAQEPIQAHRLDISAFAQIPILHEGRLKPLDSFARSEMKFLSGRDKNAARWLVELLFDPARAEQRPIIKIVNPEIRSLLQLEDRKDRLYSYSEVSKPLALQTDLIASIIKTNEEDWSVQQRDLIRLQQKATLMQNLLSSISIVLPLSFTLPEGISEPFSAYSEQRLSYYGTLSVHDSLKARVLEIYSDKGDDLKKYSDEEQILTHLSYTLSVLEETGQSAALFKVIPREKRDNWLTPWQTPEDKLALWQELASAYHDADAKKWEEIASQIRDHALEDTTIRKGALRAEYLYNSYQPFMISMICLMIGAACLVASIFKPLTLLRQSAFSLMILSLCAQLSGLATRVYILERPPVSTLYETILFVGAVVTLYSLIAFAKDKTTSNLWLWIGTSLGIFLHILGFAHNQDGDSMLMLTAVLNTNFWLATHVLCITIGYGFCALTSFMAHYTLIEMLIKKKDEPNKTLYKQTHIASLFALFFATIGTVLGGIWADQSWGRFWGWDPKENGALLIVLWLIWILHGRIAKQMNTRHTLYGLAYLSVILSLSWFGVNLLGVGLHSYGFTDSAIIGLVGFGIAETLFILGCVSLLTLRKNNGAKQHA